MTATIRNLMRDVKSEQSGAALPAVLLATFLLITASIAMLTAATANTRTGTDVISETKAYYSAESGIQSAINVLRNQNVNYKDAVNNTGGNLSTWRPSDGWNAPNGTPGHAVGSDGGYTITVSDPDNSQSQIQFTTDTTDTVGNNSSGFSLNAASFASKLGFPNTTDPNRTEISWVPDNQPAQLFNGNPNVNVSLGSFKFENFGTGVAITQKIYFRVNLRLVAPDNPVWVVKGSIDPTTHVISFTSYLYSMVGSDLTLCPTSACTSVSPAINQQTIQPPPINTAGSVTKQFWVQLTPKEPQRLLLNSIGYGPNGARKQLQAFIHKSFFPLVPPASGLLMNGPNASFTNGNGKPIYNGCDPDNPSVCVPAIGVTDSTGLTNVNGANYQNPPSCPTCPNPYPPPAIVGEDLPEWQKTPLAMDQQISEWRNVTPASSIYGNNTTISTGGFGDFATGKGLSFCDSDCTIQGNGGGILVVKGKLTTLGGVNFRGYIVVVGTGGILRNGNGGPDDTIIGGVVIAPYTLTPSPGTWLTPVFKVNGGGTSNITYSGLDYLFDGGISGTTNFVSGVAEK